MSNLSLVRATEPEQPRVTEAEEEWQPSTKLAWVATTALLSWGAVSGLGWLLFKLLHSVFG